MAPKENRNMTDGIKRHADHGRLVTQPIWHCAQRWPRSRATRRRNSGRRCILLPKGGAGVTGLGRGALSNYALGRGLGA